MKKMLLASAIVMMTSGLAQAKEPLMLSNEGNWISFIAETNKGQYVCGMKTVATDGKTFMIKWYGGDESLTIHIMKRGWEMPRLTGIPVKVTFGDQTAWVAKAIVEGEVMEFTIGLKSVSQFIMEMNSSPTMLVDFPGGRDENWTTNMAGAVTATSHFGQCVQKVGERK